MNTKPRYYIVTYGCQMNDYDSGVMAGLLEAYGWQRVNSEAEADLVVVNTCAVRSGAEERAIGRITHINRLKQHHRPEMILCLSGCIAQEWGEQLARKFPFINLIVGTRDFVRLPELVEQVKLTGRQIVAVSSIEQPLTLGVPYTVQKHNVRAGVTIIYGCDNYCAYCIVPYVRGREQSRPTQEILAEIEALARRNFKEIILLGQNVNAYHYQDVDFPSLLRMVSTIPDIARIRFVTSHPKDTSERLIETVAELDKVCENFHLPVQAGSNKILQLMNRHYTREYFLSLVKKIRTSIPSAAITTDIIAGFPNETEEDFQQTLELVEEVEFDSAFTFIYTPRPGTKAAIEYEDNVPLAVKKERLNRLIALQESISHRKNARLIGTVQEVLVEGTGRKSPAQLIGRTRTDKIVAFDGASDLLGKLVKVKINEAWPHTLMGTLVET